MVNQKWGFCRPKTALLSLSTSCLRFYLSGAFGRRPVGSLQARFLSLRIELSPFCHDVGAKTIKQFLLLVEEDSAVVVVAYGPAHLLVVHIRSVLTLPPQPRHSFRVNQAEYAFLARNPRNVLALGDVIQQLFQELPQVNRLLH